MEEKLHRKPFPLHILVFLTPAVIIYTLFILNCFFCVSAFNISFIFWSSIFIVIFPL